MPLTPLDYDIRLGPLAFTWPSDAVSETLGDSLEAVGAALTPAERRPRPLKLALRIEGRNEADPRAAGYRLRRQVRQLLENPLWLQNGLYLWWRADPELSGWVRLGGGDLEETDPGVSFGIWALSLETPYLVGRTGTHRAGRRLDLADRRTGVVPRDTRGLIYSTDFSTQALPTEPLLLPGDIVGLVTSAAHAVTTTSSPVRAGRRLYRSTAAVDGEVVAYSPDTAVLTVEAEAPVLLDDTGAVRAWDLTPAGVVYPPTTAGYSTAGDADPTPYSWERIMGPARGSSSPRVAVENGLIRLVWLGETVGSTTAYALAFEWYDVALGKFRREGRILHAAAGAPPPECSIVELTPERAIVEWRIAEKALRVVLQRGWNHVRLESYDDAAATARLDYATDTGALVVAAATPTWVKTLTANARVLYWATGTSTDANVAATLLAGGGSTGFTRVRALVAQLGSPLSSANEVAAWSLLDAQSVPVLLRRAS